MILRCCYHQILGPGSHLPKFANGCYRHSDIWVRLDPHLTWQATKSYVERGNAFGLILHHGSLTTRSGSFVRLRYSGHHIPPAEAEERYYAMLEQPAMAA